MENKAIGMCYICRKPLELDENSENCEYNDYLDEENGIMKVATCPHCGIKYEYYITESNELDTEEDYINCGDQGFGKCVHCGGTVVWTSNFMRSDYFDELKDEDDAIVRSLVCGHCGCSIKVYEPTINEMKSCQFPYWTDYFRERDKLENEMPIKNVFVYSHQEFDSYCEVNCLNDDNVEELTDKAFISIIGTEDVLKYYLEETDTKHWFKNNHINVLNLEFDDVSCDTQFEAYKAFTISEKQAEQIVNFVEENKGKTIICHCRAGLSRSYAIALWISKNFDGYSDIEEYKKGHPNMEVLRKLNNILWRKNNGF